MANNFENEYSKGFYEGVTEAMERILKLENPTTPAIWDALQKLREIG